MKRLSFIALFLLPVCCAAQYHGGADDGFSQSAAALQNALPGIYAGGANDGYSLASITNQNALPGIYGGGANDGAAIAASLGQNALPGFYTGGINDGVAFAAAAAQNILPQIYTGGENDGAAQAFMAGQNKLPAIYAGGPNDGVSSQLASGQNALPQIYTGGADDGFSMSLAQHRNPSVALNVVLLAFSGAWFNDDAVLAWRTADEQGLAHFELERSGDAGRSFEVVAQILPNTLPNQHDYRFTDVQAWHLPADFLLYRLKCVDLRGSYYYSAIVRLPKDRTQPVIVAYPNPTSGRFTLALMNVQDYAAFSYILTAPDGKLIQKSGISGATTLLDLSRQAPGVYQLVLFENGRQREHFSIVLLP